MIMEQLTELTSKGCGCLLVVDEEHHLIGTFTDGDLRRTLKASGPAIFSLTVGEMCNRFVNINLHYLACMNSFFRKYSGICRMLRSFQYICNLEMAKYKQYFLVLSIFCFHPISEVLLFYKPYKFGRINLYRLQE